MVGSSFPGPRFSPPKTSSVRCDGSPTRSQSAIAASKTSSSIGLQTGGVVFAERIAEVLFEVEATRVPVGTLDVAFYRDDVGIRPVLPEATTEMPGDLTGVTVVLVDDVLFTGRTVARRAERSRGLRPGEDVCSWR